MVATTAEFNLCITNIMKLEISFCSGLHIYSVFYIYIFNNVPDPCFSIARKNSSGRVTVVLSINTSGRGRNFASYSKNNH